MTGRASLSWLILFVVAAPNICRAQMSNIDTKHVSEEAFCVVRIDVARLVSHLKNNKKDFDSIAKMMTDETQLDPKNMKCITVQFGASDVDEGEPSFAVTFELSKKMDKEKFFEEFGGLDSYNEETINGKTYLKPNSDHEPHMYYESDLKFTMATPGAIESVLKSSGGMGNLSSKLKSAPPGSEIIAVFNQTEDFEKSIGDITRSLKELPIPFKVGDLIDNCESGLGYLNLESSNALRIRLSMNSSDSASSTKKGLDLLVALGKAALPPARAEMKKQVKGLEDAEGFGAMQREMMKVGLTSLDLSEQILNGLKIETDQKLLTVNVRKMGGMTELADLMVSGIQMTFMGFSSGADIAPAPGPEERKAIRELKLEKK